MLMVLHVCDVVVWTVFPDDNFVRLIFILPHSPYPHKQYTTLQAMNMNLILADYYQTWGGIDCIY